MSQQRNRYREKKTVWYVRYMRNWAPLSCHLSTIASLLFVHVHQLPRAYADAEVWSTRHRPLTISSKRDTILAWAKDIVPNLQEAMHKFIRPSATFVSVNNCELIWCIGTMCRLVIEWRDWVVEKDKESMLLDHHRCRFNRLQAVMIAETARV